MASVTASAVDAAAGTPKRNYARIAELTWIWSIVGYSVLRFVIAWGAFSEHGANIWVFGLIDVGTAWPYAKGVALVCKRAANSQWNQLPIPLVVAVASFFAPYAYLWFAAGEMPAGVRIGMVICVSVLMIAASGGVFAKTRKLRREAQQAADAAAQDVIDLRDEREQSDEIVIDLTGTEPVVTRSTIQSR